MRATRGTSARPCCSWPASASWVGSERRPTPNGRGRSSRTRAAISRRRSSRTSSRCGAPGRWVSATTRRRTTAITGPRGSNTRGGSTSTWPWRCCTSAPRCWPPRWIGSPITPTGLTPTPSGISSLLIGLAGARRNYPWAGEGPAAAGLAPVPVLPCQGSKGAASSDGSTSTTTRKIGTPPSQSDPSSPAAPCMLGRMKL